MCLKLSDFSFLEWLIQSQFIAATKLSRLSSVCTTAFRCYDSLKFAKTADFADASTRNMIAHVYMYIMSNMTVRLCYSIIS